MQKLEFRKVGVLFLFSIEKKNVNFLGAFRPKLKKNRRCSVEKKNFWSICSKKKITFKEFSFSNLKPKLNLNFTFRFL